MSIVLVGQAILPAAAFQAAISGHAQVFAPGERRLKASGSQDWPPHNLSRIVLDFHSKRPWVVDLRPGAEGALNRPLVEI
jgi:hypothetical protein